MKHMKHLKKPVALVLALSLVFSLSVTGFAAPADETENEPVALAGEEESGNTITVEVSTATELQEKMMSEEYSDCDTLILSMQNDIEMTDENGDAVQIINYRYSSSSNSNVIVEGNGNTLSSHENEAKNTEVMFKTRSNSLNRGVNLTFRDMTIDAKQQCFFLNTGGYLGGSSLTLDNVKLKNFYGDGSASNSSGQYGGFYLTGTSAQMVSALVLNQVTTEDCVGTLFYLSYIDEVSVTNSDLSMKVNENGTKAYDAAFCLYYYVNLSVDGSSINYSDSESKYACAFYQQGENDNISITGGTKILGEVCNKDSVVFRAEPNGAKVAIDLGDCTIQNTGGSLQPVINMRQFNTVSVLQISGDVQGEPLIQLRPDEAYIQLSTALKSKLNYEFTSDIAGTDPLVATGTEATDEDPGYALTEEDLAYLVYADEDSSRTLRLNTEDGCAYLCRPDIQDCDVTLDATNAEGTYDGENGIGPIFQRNENDAALEPEVTVTLDGKPVSAENYTVEYEGATTVPKGTDRGTTLNAWATVTPAGELAGDFVTRPYYIEVSTTYELTADNTETVLTYENGTYSTKVTYNGQALTEDKDYTVVYRIDGDSYTVTATITGAGNYIGSYELTFDLPGKRTVTKESELNQALEQKVAYIEFGDDIDDLTGPVVVDYDVVIDGAGYTLSPDEMANDLGSDFNYAVLSVSSGNVVVTDLTVDGNDQARLLYVGSEADVTMTGSTLQHGALGIPSENQINPRRGMTAYIEEGGTLTLDGCIVRDGGRAYPPIYNMGELNIQNETYLTNLPDSTSTYAIQNIGTLNWTSGTFDVNASYTSTTMTTGAVESGTVIQNQGIFNMSGTAELNGYLLDENEQHTDEQAVVVTGAVHVTGTGEFNLSGDAVITGFQSRGFGSGFETNNPSGGGGVYNNGIFNMSGGMITGNSTESAGGGVFNAGVFNMTGGEITGNTAAIGGGIYNDYARDYTHDKSSYVMGAYDAGEFYMSGGIVSDNYLTSDTIEIEGRNFGRMGEDKGSIGAVGSELYVSGGCTAEISGGTISGATESKVASDGGEDDTGDTVVVSVGIAAVPSQNQNEMQSDGNIVVADNVSMTVTGTADIDTGIALVSWNNWSTTGYLANKEEVQNDPDTPYDITNVTEPVLTTNQDSWLELDGNLATALKINKLDVENVTMTLTNVDGMTASNDNMPERIDDGSGIYVNPDGALVAVYKDRVTPDENDAKWLQVDASSIFMSYETRTYESEVTVYDDEDDDEGHTEMVETTVNAYMWVICNHTEGLEYAPAEEATCTESGNNACWYCPVCLKLFEDEAGTIELSTDKVYIAALGHEIQNVDQLDATCTEEGYTAGAMCVRCGMFFDDYFHEQSASERVIEALGHNYVIMPAVPATATTDGWSEYVWCDRCETNLTEPELIPAGSEEEPDSSALEALVDATEAMTEKMNSSDYTADSWENLQDALTKAKNVADNPDSTQEDVTAAMEDLTAAINGLEPAGGSGEDKIGFVQEGDEWHYYNSDGTRFTGTDIKEDTKKVVDGTDSWFYIENGKINFSCNSVEQNAYGWWYVLNGKVDFSYTGVANYSNAYGWWYISDGKVDFSKTGIEPNNYGWWRVVNGQVDFSCNSVEQNDYGWWYLVGGKVQFDYTGVANYANANGWWYINGGKVDFSKTSIEQNNYGWWRVVNGKVDFSCNSVEQNDYGWWYVIGGKVQFSYTGVVNYTNAYGWWYVKGGKVDFSYTGRASNNYGTWNVVNGKVVF